MRKRLEQAMAFNILTVADSPVMGSGGAGTARGRYADGRLGHPLLKQIVAFTMQAAIGGSQCLS